MSRRHNCSATVPLLSCRVTSSSLQRKTRVHCICFRIYTQATRWSARCKSCTLTCTGSFSLHSKVTGLPCDRVRNISISSFRESSSLFYCILKSVRLQLYSSCLLPVCLPSWKILLNLLSFGTLFILKHTTTKLYFNTAEMY